MNGTQKRLTVWTVGPLVAGGIAVLAWWGGHEAAVRAEGYKDGTVVERLNAIDSYHAQTSPLIPLLQETSTLTRTNKANIEALAVSVRDLVDSQRETNRKLDRLIETLAAKGSMR